MKSGIYCIFDKKAETYNSPFIAPTEPHAIRSFAAMVNHPDANNQLYTHAEDFELYKSGEVDMNTAELENITPRLIATGAALQKPHANDADQRVIDKVKQLINAITERE